MAKRLGRYTIQFTNEPIVAGFGSSAGKKESEGPLKQYFDNVFTDTSMGENTWEAAESDYLQSAVKTAMKRANVTDGDLDGIFSGDLLDQCIASTFGLKQIGAQHIGLFGACSTMALSTIIASIAIDSGALNCAVAATSSHFCSAEKQFRMPLEYGGQRSPTAQWTASASGAAVLCAQGNGPRIGAVIFGKITDYGIKDANNMGAAMAPAACDTIAAFLRDTKTSPEEYDMILTGDLGAVGTTLLLELLMKEHGMDLRSVHADCGLMLYDKETQDVHAGGSGCGCSGSVVCSYILRRLRERSLRRVLFVGTGALLSGVSALQKESIPAVAHLVELTAPEKEN